MLAGKKILLGVTGSIAAYKSAVLCRLLVKAGAEVQVIFSESAQDFITPLTLSTLSKKPVLSSFIANTETGIWNNHVELGLWADILLIAPCSANTMAKMATGICDNLLLATYLSARCPVMIAPAMDLDMWLHFSTQHNYQTLVNNGILMVEPESGALASGLDGKGRMAEPEHIVEHLERAFGSAVKKKSKFLEGKQVLVTAGPTHEAIDPVRFIGNRSSGKMGFALAEAAINFGAKVTLIAGPNHLKVPQEVAQYIPVTSAAEMHKACKEHAHFADLIIMAAAVADYTPENPSAHKIKKQENALDLKLTKTQDILADLGANKKANQVLVGFALETNNEHENALGKLERKKLDAIVLNSLNDKGAGFEHDTNTGILIFKNGTEVVLPLDKKSVVADKILTELCVLF
ncbi:MAG: bifunctional phosphopantothenoylcysteine decarboxylase/phosphopantothenate--cysteine ligase CoaBC [Luteibaculaceae bacterium]